MNWYSIKNTRGASETDRSSTLAARATMGRSPNLILVALTSLGLSTLIWLTTVPVFT